VKERRERTMGDFTTEAAVSIDPLDYMIAERFRAERHPERSVDGDDRYERDPFDIPDDELPGMWERSGFLED
jgi:hypothetical protein